MAKITFISNVTNENNIFKNLPGLKSHEVKIFTLSDSVEKILEEAKNTEILVADAMAKIGGDIISGMPDLKFIQSEGVGYQGFDLESAKKNGVMVSNNKGVNDTAVAECAVLLILACLKNLTSGQRAVYEGRQIEVKKASFGTVRELSECTVGLVGFGDIGRATARLLSDFGARVLYSNRTRYRELENEYHAEYASLDTLLNESDFVSLHLAVCDETRNIANRDFFSKMKNGAYLINTARGDLVDNRALLDAVLCGKIAGAGLDVISPEPVTKDNILLDPRIEDRLVLTPHIAGITSLTVTKIFNNINENIKRVLNGDEPVNRVV